MKYLIAGIIFLIVSLAMWFIVILTLTRSLKKEKKFISKRNFAFFLSSILILYFIFFTGAVYNEQELNPLFCFSLINSVTDLMKFKLKIELLLPLCKAYPIFYADFFLAFISFYVTAVLSVASLFSLKLYNFIKVKSLLRKRCDIVIGYSDNAVNYLKNTPNSVLLGNNLAGDTYISLIKKGIHVSKLRLESRQLEKILQRGKVNVIVFRNNDVAFSSVINTFAKIESRKFVNIYFEADESELAIIKRKFLSKGDKIPRMYLTSFNKHELIAKQFILDYPISKYIPREFFEDNFALKNGKKINVVLVGFGNVNASVFKMMARHFQFVCENPAVDEKNTLKPKFISSPVNYYIYEKDGHISHCDTINQLNSIDERFAKCDFPKPEKVCNFEVITKVDVYEKINEFCEKVDKDSFTYFIISLDADLKDASFADSLERTLVDAGKNNYRIFVRAKNTVDEDLNNDEDSKIYFGSEKRLYSHEVVVDDEILDSAMKNHESYMQQGANKQREDKNGEETKGKTNYSALDLWDDLDQTMQLSNMDLSFNLPFKLGLLGFEIEKDSVDTHFEKRFKERYNFGKDNVEIDDKEKDKNRVEDEKNKKYENIETFFGKHSGNVLAYIEHSRWNALYLLSGYSPFPKAKIKAKKDDNGELKVNHKNNKELQHACLTTYEGLKDIVELEHKLLIEASDKELERINSEKKQNKKDNNDNREERIRELYKKALLTYSYDCTQLDGICEKLKKKNCGLVDTKEYREWLKRKESQD